MPTYVPGKLILAKTYVGIDDPDAQAYITAVEAADTAAGESGGLETATKVAIHSFVKGCKNDGIWPAIKASCILAGARTYKGALVPLAGPNPINVSNNFVSGDYDRKTGLKGNAGNKYLDTNYASNNQTGTNRHCAAYLGTASYGQGCFLAAGDNGSSFSGYDSLDRVGGTSRVASMAGVSFAGTFGFSVTAAAGLIGMSRNNSSNFTRLIPGLGEGTSTFTAQSSQSLNFLIFARRFDGSQPNFSSDASIAFYSIGESLNLALLNARVTTLINAFAAAIP